MKALVSSASGAASDLDSIAATAAHKAIAGAGFEPVPATARSPAGIGSSISSGVAHRIEERWDLTAGRAILTA